MPHRGYLFVVIWKNHELRYVGAIHTRVVQDSTYGALRILSLLFYKQIAPDGATIQTYEI